MPFWKNDKTETRLKSIEDQIKSNASRVSDLSQKVEERLVDTTTRSKKEFAGALDELRTSFEQLSLEMNNQMLEISQSSSVCEEQLEEFRKNYADVLEDLRQSTAIALEKEQIMTRKYEELVDQLKEKEELNLEKEALSQKRIDTLQTEQEKKLEEVRKLEEKIDELEDQIKTKNEKIETLSELKPLEKKVKQLMEEVELHKYELERSQTKIQGMKDDTVTNLASNRIIKTFLVESESGRILNHLLGLEQVSIDELASMTGIATFTVQQIVSHFQDIGIVNIDKATRKVSPRLE